MTTVIVLLVRVGRPPRLFFRQGFDKIIGGIHYREGHALGIKVPTF